MNGKFTATLQERYEESTSDPFGPSTEWKRAVQITDRRGKPVAVFQTVDSRGAIEAKLRAEGWSVLSWEGDIIQISKADQNAGRANGQSRSGTKPQLTPRKKKLLIGSIAVMVLGFSACTAAVASQPAKPPVADAITAQIMCEQFVKDKLKAPSTAKFSNHKDREGKAAGTWVSVGLVEAQNAFGGTVGHNYRCNLTWDPKADSWTSETTLSER